MATKFKKDQRVIVKLKEDLIEELGKNEFGYPKTSLAWNTKGHMDHYFGESGVITEINSTFIEIKLDNEVSGKKYGWALSVDMIVAEDGSYTPITASKEPIRKFMPKTTKPITRTVWKQLQALQKKEELPEGSLAPLLGLYLRKPFDEFTKHMTHAEAFRPSASLAKAKLLQAYYPKMNIEVLVFLWENRGAPKASEIYKGTKMFLALATNKEFAAEFDDKVPFTPIKRMSKTVKPNDIDKVWDNLVISETLDSSRAFEDISALKTHMVKVVSTYMDKNSLVKLTDQKITIR